MTSPATILKIRSDNVRTFFGAIFLLETFLAKSLNIESEKYYFYFYVRSVASSRGFGVRGQSTLFVRD